MKKIILYGSKYGTAKWYAKTLSERSGIPVESCDAVSDLSGYEGIILIGALYAGGMLGLKQTLRVLPKEAKLIIATVGLADVTDDANVQNIQSSIHCQASEEILSRTSIYHLRGGIDYGKLSFTHAVMMRLLYQKAKGLPPEKQTAEVRAMLDTYGKKVDFTDEAYLIPIEQEIATWDAAK